MVLAYYLPGSGAVEGYQERVHAKLGDERPCGNIRRRESGRSEESGINQQRSSVYRAHEQQDATQSVSEWVGQMDAVICDVPCSGLGIIRKKPDIRYKNLAEMEGLPALQLEILRNQAAYVKPGGVLMYSTCTVLRRENEEVAEAFLKENDDFYREALDLPEVFPKNETGMLTLIPGEYDTDGFFICRMRRDT